MFLGFRYSYNFKNIITNFTSTDTIQIISEESLLNEVRSVNKIIPLEVNLSESIIIDKSFGSLDIFKKYKTITFFAQCSYSMDLSTVTSNDILLNNENKEITLLLSKPEIYSINIDENKTKYSAAELGLLRFGDIELSSEEYSYIRTSVISAFKDKLEDDTLHKQALTNTALSLEDLISNLTGQNYTINIKVKK